MILLYQLLNMEMNDVNDGFHPSDLELADGWVGLIYLGVDNRANKNGPCLLNNYSNKKIDRISVWSCFSRLYRGYKSSFL